MLLRLIRRSLFLRRQRLLLGVLSVAAGTAVAVGFADLSLVFGDRLSESLRAYGANLVLVPEGGLLSPTIPGTDFQPAVRTAAIAESSLADLHRSYWRNNLLGYAPVLQAVGYLEEADGEARQAAVALVGTWFERHERGAGGRAIRAGMVPIAPWWKVEGALPPEEAGAGADAVPALAGGALAKRHGLFPGSRVRLRSGGGNAMTLLVTGTLDAGGLEDETLYLPLAAAQRLTGRPGEVDRVLVSALIKPGFPPAPDRAADPEAYERWFCTPFVTSVAHDLDRTVPGVEARPVAQFVEAEGRVVHRLNLLLLLLTLAAATAAALGVMGTLTAIVVERTREFALQRSLGATRAMLLRHLAVEALAVGLVGGVLGSALGLLLAQLAGRLAFGVRVPFHPLVLLLGLVVAVLVTAAGAAWPLRFATRQEPAEGLRA
jgi:putative ABC transport system permease protein